MTRATSAALLSVLLGSLLAVGCATGPRIRAQSAPEAQLDSYRTYGFFEKLGTDDAGYASALSQNLKAATAREMEARGYRPSPTPDLLINFHVERREKIEGASGPSFGVGFGRGWGSWRSGYSWGVGISDTQVSSRTEGTLTIDVVDRARNELVWAGTATGMITSKMLDDPRAAIDATVPKVFAEFPGRAAP